ncbi:rhomboid family intramembrane serine protease [Mesonia sp.]|uniref:rhomboid family intramembrane serine protease n=1 Tax=Mesonia sp. TaxID=1960830 RepID=UPI0017738FFA|nr:rhomboid family intramembrane serine protease [Mesonia sp.]HIB37020.1 rhomboid family intramembrane serine protease [Mesonia sp.]HIO27395.1 rhomboid family intramembrane serine protease [Flavobacteriaceae bacterium]
MNTQKNIQHLDLINLGIPLLSVLVIWIIYWIEVKFGFSLNYLGVSPHSIKGLRGVLFSPFIHGSIEHLYSNTIPLFLLSLGLFYFYRKLAIKVLCVGWLLSGILTWLIGEEGSTHIGASGIIYLLASFLFFKGIWSKNYRLMAISFIVIFLYGSLVWGVLPGEAGISWEGHLSGFLSGLFLAFIFRKVIIVENKKFSWQQETYREEEDEFMKHFDENGNFIPTSELYPENDEDYTSPSDSTNSEWDITYTFKANKNDE